ncbi:MAG: hypothetical protein HQM10_07860 [Candidatus Riflebacteria bacterium]|nr:hypothetical protein [Candidatus Riflebacteria bacterium]
MFIEKIKTLSVSDAKKKSICDFCKGITECMQQNLIALYIYGSAVRDDFKEGISNINIFSVMQKIDISILRNCLDVISKGRRDNISTFLLTNEELQNSLDVFPGKIFSIKEDGILLAGTDLLSGIKIDNEYLRLKCEEEIRTVMLKLRRNFLSRNGAFLLAPLFDFAREVREVLRIMFFLQFNKIVPRKEIIIVAAKTWEYDFQPIQIAIDLRFRTNEKSNSEIEEIYGKFMDCIAFLAKKADRKLA